MGVFLFFLNPYIIYYGGDFLTYFLRQGCEKGNSFVGFRDLGLRFF